LFLLKTFKALNGLLCADMPLRNYSLTHLLKRTRYFWLCQYHWMTGQDVGGGIYYIV